MISSVMINLVAFPVLPGKSSDTPQDNKAVKELPGAPDDAATHAASGEQPASAQMDGTRTQFDVIDSNIRPTGIDALSSKGSARGKALTALLSEYIVPSSSAEGPSFIPRASVQLIPSGMVSASPHMAFETITAST